MLESLCIDGVGNEWEFGVEEGGGMGLSWWLLLCGGIIFAMGWPIPGPIWWWPPGTGGPIGWWCGGGPIPGDELLLNMPGCGPGLGGMPLLVLLKPTLCCEQKRKEIINNLLNFVRDIQIWISGSMPKLLHRGAGIETSLPNWFLAILGLGPVVYKCKY